MDEFDLESLVHVEQTFFDIGYQDGYDHGRIHGLIEGRALGGEKGFEMWEEVGFYEGFAMTWRAIHTKEGKSDDRISHNITSLLDIISHFPIINPSAANSNSDPSSELDISKLLRQIRSKYKLLCATLGVRPRLRVTDGATSPNRHDDLDDLDEESSHKASVWKINKSAGPVKPGQDFSF